MLRALLAVLLAGLVTTGTAVVRTSGRVRPASPWSLAERLSALRIERGLPANIHKQATVSLRGAHAVLKVREQNGPVLLKCPLAGRDLAESYVAYATTGSAPGCDTQAVDEAGDVLVYEVSGRVAPLCPGQFSTLTEQQLHNALYLPAVGGVLDEGHALAKGAGALVHCADVKADARFEGDKPVQPDDVATSLYYLQWLAQTQTPPPACGPVPMSVHLSTLLSEAITATTVRAFLDAQQWAPDVAGELRAYFDKHSGGVCIYARGLDLDRPADAEMAAQALAFPVFAPFDPRSPKRASPLLRALQHDETLAALRCDLIGEHACKLKRDRIAAQLHGALGKLGAGLSNLASDEIPYHIGASGPFHLADYDLLHVTLESNAEVQKKGSSSKLLISYQPLWPESVPEKRLACASQPGVCLFRALWRTEGARAPDPAEDGFESLVALFARRDANTRCVRRLYNALAAGGEDRMLELQRDLRDAVGAGENRAPCDPRARSMAGLVPRTDESAGCPDAPQAPFGDVDDTQCRQLSLVYVQEEPWAAVAARIRSIAAGRGVSVSVSGIKASEVHRGSLGSWDVLLTVASNYYNRKYPTLVPLLHPAGNQNLSGGQAISETPGRQILAAYESSIVYPPPAWLGPAGSEPPTRAESLRLLEDDVARNGPAPIYPLAFLRPATLTLPSSQSEAARSPWYFARLVQNWSTE